LNNKIVSTTKKISTIFFAIVLVTGTLALSFQSSFMVGTNAQAQPYYDGGMDSYGSSNYGNDNSYESQYQSSYKPDYKPQYPSYDGKDDNRDKFQKDSSKSVSINKLKCINTNININGNNSGNINVGNKGKVAGEEGYSGAYSSGGSGYGGSEGYDNKKDKGFDCVINNNNTNINNGGGNQTIPPVPPEQKATLNVTKLVTCDEVNGGGSLIPDIDPTCTDLEGNITEDQFNITVTDTDPTPSQFTGSETGTIVTLGAGSYTVTETFNASISENIEALGGNITGPNITFTGDCTQTGVNSTSATGTIAAGEQQDCNIVNNFVINVTDTCPECFERFLTDDQLAALETYLTGFRLTLETYCALFVQSLTPQDVIDGPPGGGLLGDFPNTTPPIVLSQEDLQALAECIFAATHGGTNNNIAGLPPVDVFSEETDSPGLTALEKIEKLKTQWLDLLP
jgi:hypothetical protein